MEAIQLETDCDKCAYRNSIYACAMGVDPEEECPGYHPKDCPECLSNPCTCEELGNVMVL